MWWFGRGMFQGVLIGPFRANVYPCSGGVLLAPVGRAYVPFCRRLVVWRAFCFAFAVVTHPCWWLVFLLYHIHAIFVSPFLFRQRWVVRGTLV